MMVVLVSVIVGLCAATWVYHVTCKANTGILGFSSGPTWKLVIITFIGISVLVYGLVGL